METKSWIKQLPQTFKLAKHQIVGPAKEKSSDTHDLESESTGTQPSKGRHQGLRWQQKLCVDPRPAFTLRRGRSSQSTSTCRWVADIMDRAHTYATLLSLIIFHLAVFQHYEHLEMSVNSTGVCISCKLHSPKGNPDGFLGPPLGLLPFSLEVLISFSLLLFLSLPSYASFSLYIPVLALIWYLRLQ